MTIIEIESDWRETGIICPLCGCMTYSDGKHRPQCGNNDCLEYLPSDLGLCPDCGKDYFVAETIIDGELRCSCARR